MSFTLCFGIFLTALLILSFVGWRIAPNRLALGAFITLAALFLFLIPCTWTVSNMTPIKGGFFLPPSPTITPPLPTKKPDLGPCCHTRGKGKKTAIRGHPELMKVVREARKSARFRVVRVGKSYVDIIPRFKGAVRYEDWKRYSAMVTAMVRASNDQGVADRITFGKVGGTVHTMPSSTFGVAGAVQDKADKQRHAGNKKRSAIRYRWR